MNLSRLLFVNGGIALHSHGHRSFETIQPDRLSFLLPVKSAAEPVAPSGNVPDSERDPASAGPGPSKPERAMFWAMLGLVVLALLCCGFGVQRISHIRAQNQLGLQLRERDLALQRLTTAYRVLEASKAVEVAKASQPQLRLPMVAELRKSPATIARLNQPGRLGELSLPKSVSGKYVLGRDVSPKPSSSRGETIALASSPRRISGSSAMVASSDSRNARNRS